MSINDLVVDLLYNKLNIKFKVPEPEMMTDIGLYIIDYLYVVQQSVYYKLEDLRDFVDFWERFALSDNRPDYIDWASLSLTRYNQGHLRHLNKYNRDLISNIKILIGKGLVDDSPIEGGEKEEPKPTIKKEIEYPEEEVLLELNKRVSEAMVNPKMWEA